MDYNFFNVWNICGFTSTPISIWFRTSYTFVFTTRSKYPILDIILFIVNVIHKQENKLTYSRVYNNGTLSSYTDFMNTWNNINIIVKTTGGYSFSINVKLYTTNKICAQTTRYIFLNSSHNTNLWCLSFQYTIWIIIISEYTMRKYEYHRLCNNSTPHNKIINIWGTSIYVINDVVHPNMTLSISFSGT